MTTTAALRLPLVLLACFGIATTAGARQGERDPLAGLDALVGPVMLQWQVPGVAVAVVEGDGRVRLFAFGRRDLDPGLPVTSDTLFAVGSVTKAFTATAIAMLVDRRLLGWNDPVGEKLPDFALADSEATEQATTVDLLAHRTGLARHDLVWVRTDLSRADLLPRLRFLESASPFREQWRYNNLMYMAAGCLLERVSGQTWEHFVRSRILEPLGMDRSLLSTPARDHTNVARPHRWSEGAVWEAPFYEGWAAAPAGSLHTSAKDIANWLRFQLTDGRLAGTRLLSPQQMEALHTPRVTVPMPASLEIPATSYALGWFVDTYRGHRQLWHNGGIDGFYALVGLLPEDGIGVAVLTNCSDNRVPEVVSRWVYDRLLGLAPIDWNRRLQSSQAELDLLRERRVRERRARAASGGDPSLPRSGYIGLYRHPAYGDLTVVDTGSGLRASFHHETAALVHLGRDIFLLPADPRGFGDDVVLQFVRGDARMVSVRSALEPSVRPIVFDLVPPPPS